MNRRGIGMMSSAHMVDDLYQGIVPAMLPFLVSERHYSYAAVAGLTLAATMLSSVVQPAFGVWTDRKPRRWLIPLGMTTAALGVGAAGLFPSYAVTWVMIAISGLGIAAFHPSAASAARRAAGDSNKGMSIFALGGNIGFALGSLLATPVLLWFGLRGTALLVLPALVMALILARRLGPVLDGRDGERRPAAMPKGRDNWPDFLKLTSIVVVRSIVFFGLSSFLALYFIHGLGASEVIGGAALTVFLVSGACGTLLGGWLADRFGAMVSIRYGFACCLPAMAGLVLVREWRLAMVFVVLTGVSIFVPFSVFVILGQNYLPNRIGTASGVTVGLAVTVGGLFNPVLGVLADATTLHFTLTVLIALPALALALSAFLHDPATADRLRLQKMDRAAPTAQ
ncbi:FSR family fosmidomycin resistance protein-like MFS transporter [Arthrobacter silviterrae]|nr:MFS transporter [Arthrobacter silviterrae]MDQ0278656.1 FSR family fosmidomycin resistance protein-like MFS transporter [Arthrobacter silviterrae]